MASPLNLRLAIAQLNPTLGALDANTNKIIEAWDQADDNADIIVGAIFDQALEGKFRVSIVATGLRRSAKAAELRHELA